MAATPADPAEAAHSARLRHVSDDMPGITRRRVRKGFAYRYPDGRPVRDPRELDRIRAIVIPPAWTDVWICPFANGHIQATGRDARGRKQYRYHPRWRAVRDETKYEHMLRFGEVLPRIRRRVAADLNRPGLPREKVLAAVVQLMESTLARVGNPEYAKENHSFGLTTLQNRHVRVTRRRVELDFRTKHGVRHHSVVSDRKLARILKQCRDLPGSELFQYVDEEGRRHSIDSTDLNDYLRDIAGRDVTAKDFRTWAATNLAVLAVAARGDAPPSKRAAAQVVREVAEQLGNTPAVCRTCYIHPRVLAGYLDGTLTSFLSRVEMTREAGDREPEIWEIEAMVMRFLASAELSR